MEVLKLDFGRIANPIIEQASGLERNTLTRVAHIALPYLNFDPRIGKFAHVTMSCLDTLQNVRSFPLLSNVEIAEKVVQISMTVSSTALSILAPHISTQVSFAIGALSNSSEACWGAYNQDYQKAFYATLRALGYSVQYTALVYSTTGMIAASLLVSCAQYLAQAYTEFNNDENSWLQLIEAASHTLLAANTLYLASPKLKELYYNYGKQKLTQEQWHAFCDSIETLYEEEKRALKASRNRYTPVDFETKIREYRVSHSKKITTTDSDQKYEVSMSEFLRAHNFSTTLSKLKLHLPSTHRILWDGITFDKCLFNCVDATDSYFKDVVFNQCEVLWLTIHRSHIVNTTFQNMSLENVHFYSCLGGKLQIINCTNAQHFFKYDFLNILFKQCHFPLVNLPKGEGKTLHFEACHFEDPTSLAGAKQTACTVSGLDKTPLAFPTYEEQDMGEFATHIQRILARNGARTVLCPREPNVDAGFTSQIVDLLKEYDPKSGMSRSQYLFAKAEEGSPIARIYNIALHVVRNTQGVVLPGGPNVCSALYKPLGQSNLVNLQQSVMEAAYIVAADKLKRPIMGVCRGHQLLAVVYGGTLKETEDGNGYKLLHVNSKLSRFAAQFFDPIIENQRAISFAAHRQAVDKMPCGFEEVMRHKNVVEVMVKDGRVIGSQTHPEIIEKFDAETRFLTRIAHLFKTREMKESAEHELLNGSAGHRYSLSKALSEILPLTNFSPEKQEEIYRNFVRLASNSS